MSTPKNRNLPQPPGKLIVSAENALLALWLFAIIASLLTHELWRDETREYLLAVGIDNFSEYFNYAKVDGHPLLWRTILIVLHWLVPHPVILPMASILIGFLTVYLFVKYSPFPLLHKALFIFGVVVFSANTVEARDYGISMLLFFLFAVFYCREDRHPIVIGVLLFLEANTNQYGMYLSGLLLACWIADSGFHVLKDKRYIIAALIALLGIGISLYSTRIDADSVFVPSEYLAQITYAQDIIKAFKHPGEFIYYILNIPIIYRDLLVILLIIGLLAVRPYLGLTLYVAIVIFNFVAITFIYPQTRHQGVLYGFIIVLFWMTLHGIKTHEKTGWFKHAKTVFYFILFAVLLPFMAHEVQINYSIVDQEARVEKSSAMALGKFLSTNEPFHKAIIIGSPEYMLEPIAYYSGNRIFLTQEKRFRNFVSFSKEFDTDSSLSSLLDTAEKLNSQEQVPVLIVLGYFGIKEGMKFSTIYRGTFLIDQLDRFKKETVKLLEFNNSLGDENYQVFLYLPQNNLTRYRNKYMEIR